MTQLVQLQEISVELAANGFALFAISNDPVEILAEFAERHGITFPLLSDAPESAVIREFGIMNQLIDPSEGRSMRWYGIPYPGTYFLGPDGRVADKEFHQHHARRASAPTILARASGREVDVDMAETAAATSGGVEVRVAMADPTLKLEVISTLVVEVAIPEGKHCYAPGAPEEFTPLNVEVSGAGIRAYEQRWPEAENANPPTYSGRVRVEVPLTVTSELVRLGHGIEVDTAEIQIDLEMQLCDEVTCELPQALSHTVQIPIDLLVMPEGLKRYAERVSPTPI